MITGLLLICILGGDCQVQVSQKFFNTFAECERMNQDVMNTINSNAALNYRVMGTKCIMWGEEEVV